MAFMTVTATAMAGASVIVRVVSCHCVVVMCHDHVLVLNHVCLPSVIPMGGIRENPIPVDVIPNPSPVAQNYIETSSKPGLARHLPT